MDCVIQAFPDEFHLHTLESVLDTTTQLNSNVDIKNIYINLMERLAKYATDSDITQVNENLDIFRLFKKSTDKIIEE